MKKKNLYIEKAFQITEILNKEKNLYLPKLNSLKIEAEKIKQINDKIIFWETEKRKYLSELSLETFATSGVVSIDMPNNTELFLDREITIEINKLKNQLPTEQTETKTEKLKAELGKYGFFELPKVKQLSEPNKQKLINLISTNDLPYSIAMIEYLGLIKHLQKEYFTVRKNLFKAVANWFEVDERQVKGNIYVLDTFSKENRTRYTAHLRKQIVQNNYETLK